MRSKAIVVAAVVIVVLLFTAMLFSGPRKPPQDITVRHVKSVQSGDLVLATFEITNHTTSRCFVYPISVEVSNGLVWKKCFDFTSFPGPILKPNGCESSSFYITNLPIGSPLRLRICIRKELAGLERLFLRLDLRFRDGNTQVSLNPFDKRLKAFSSKRTEIVSDEFVEPEPSQ